MLRVFKKIKFITNPLPSLAESMINIDKAYEEIVMKSDDMYDDLDYVKQLALKLLLKKVLDVSIEIVIKQKKIKENDEAIDYLIDEYPDAFNIWSINTNFNIQFTAQNCIQVYNARYGEVAEARLDSDLRIVQPDILKQYVA